MSIQINARCNVSFGVKWGCCMACCWRWQLCSQLADRTKDWPVSTNSDCLAKRCYHFHSQILLVNVFASWLCGLGLCVQHLGAICLQASIRRCCNCGQAMPLASFISEGHCETLQHTTMKQYHRICNANSIINTYTVQSYHQIIIIWTERCCVPCTLLHPQPRPPARSSGASTTNALLASTGLLVVFDPHLAIWTWNGTAVCD